MNGMEPSVAAAGADGASAAPDPRAAIEAAIAADRAHADPAIWIARGEDAALRAAAARLAVEGPRGRPLWGQVFAVKDNIDVAGWATTAACPAYAYQAAASAPAVARLVAAGALVMGKTNLDQFATGLVGTRSPYGVPRNVFASAHVPGGSSSGSAVAVAAGIVRFALGTDTAGSGRVPAAFGQIVGLKPSLGAIPTTGVVPACHSLDTVSVFAATVDDALAVARVAAGSEAAFARAALPPAWRLGIADVGGLCAPAVAAAYARAGALAPAAIMVDVAPLLEVARLLYDGPWVAERTAALRDILETAPEAIHPVTRAILREGYQRSAVDAFAAFRRLAEVKSYARELFAGIDALLLPTAPFCPSLAEDAADPVGPNRRLGVFTNFLNLCELAAFAVPSGIGADGLPAGVMVIGPAGSEPRLAPIADLLHRGLVATTGATGVALPPPLAPAAAGPGEAVLFCLGAHMSGLPLNREIVALGGRFLRTARTAPCYRLFDLGSRPGMVRAKTGGAIAGELWVLPRAALGALLADPTAPIGLGGVRLDCGSATGFLVEAEATTEAPEITRFGGWRAYLARAEASPAGA
jgi:allophanate hydrolase